MAVLLKASWAVTVKLNEVPAVTPAGAVTAEWLAAGRVHRTAGVEVRGGRGGTDRVAVAVTGTSGGLQRGRERPDPAGQGGIGRQGGCPVRAGEVDGAAVAGGGVVAERRGR